MQSVMLFCYIVRGRCSFLFLFLHYHLNIECFAVLWIPVECFLLHFLLSSHECPGEYTCGLYIHITYVYAYINLSYIIVTLVCIISNHHFVYLPFALNLCIQLLLCMTCKLV